MPAWGWLLPLALLALVYPLNAWRDAPLFPTPGGALNGLAALAPMAAGARLLDAGCGLGDGLRELHREYPDAELHGLEWRLAAAPVVRLALRLRARAAWRHLGRRLVALRHRLCVPASESMARAVEKATRELRPGAWLVSLEFDAPGFAPTKVIECADGRRLWLYRVPFRARAALS